MVCKGNNLSLNTFMHPGAFLSSHHTRRRQPINKSSVQTSVVFSNLHWFSVNHLEMTEEAMPAIFFIGSLSIFFNDVEGFTSHFYGLLWPLPAIFMACSGPS